jgi:hypothetical protein
MHWEVESAQVRLKSEKDYKSIIADIQCYFARYLNFIPGALLSNAAGCSKCETEPSSDGHK